MKILPLVRLPALVVLAVACMVLPSFGQETAASPAAVATDPVSAPSVQKPSEEEVMKQMMELSKLNDNHKLLASLAGDWTYTVKMWMNPDPSAPPTQSTGKATRKAVMSGRFFSGEFGGKFKMPGVDGKMMGMDFQGRSLEGYDNVKKKFVSAWVDNMGTGIEMSEGTYDPATKTLNYTSEVEALPGMKMKVRETIKIVDHDHHIFEWFEDRGGREAKTLEISYTRKK